ncbi:hypothetical protein CHLRE_01g014700v5 [Chlamydomonas reinhardtii]|uniref:C962R-like N-terminal AEP domain-containing protein n=1 Tax=Chlamydomonas reinhardtii TaxID=3055 RepID=A0A2K3E5N8_CHLRE|nr:uncharacterized protein CHLRE_01g014700v5 [Chlamydomonas reinhardtii]PNW88111.1 hypothetical protein CHLRE_01g014700v5 [Chlamydomonas reinhardtii]
MSGGSQQELSSAGQAAGSSASEGNRGKAREYHPRAPEPPYAVAYAYRIWPSKAFRNYKLRPDFLEAFPVPAGKTFNVNSFLGPKDAQKGQYYVPQPRYRQFLESYVSALEDGYQMYLTENYQQQVYKYFVELDWDWDTDLARVMEVTPLLIELISATASAHYTFPSANVITSIRTPYKVHLNYPQLLTTELLASGCRDRILAAIREHPRLCGMDVDWERLIDFPHGSLRLMGSKKAPWMDSDPAWVAQQDKAYAPAKLGPDGRWRPTRLTAGVLAAASIFPRAEQVAAFERSPAYLDMIFNDFEASKQRMEERRRRRMELREQYQQTGPPVPQVPLPPGSSKLPLVVSLEVQPDESVALKIYIKSKYRTKAQPKYTYKSSMRPGAGQAGVGTGDSPAQVGHNSGATGAEAPTSSAGRGESQGAA